MNNAHVLIVSILFLFSCSEKKVDTSLFEPQQRLGKVSKKLSEASGLIASIKNPGYLWTLNDGRNPAEIYLINEKAEIVMTCKLKNIANRDWEDIVIGPGPEQGVNYLYIADIGDNEAVYPYKILYRIKEPELADKKIEIEDIDKLVFQLPDGVRDSETIMVDPITNVFYIFSKREKSIRLYEIKFSMTNDTLQAISLAKLPFTNIVAGGISPNGHEVLLKNYTEIFYWKRIENESIVTLLQKEPIKLNYDPEHQGEALAWKRDNSGFYTLSESGMVTRSDLFFYRRK